MGPAFFISGLVIIVVVVLGGGVYALTAWLRHRKLAGEDTVETRPADASGNGSRPEHLRVENEQRSHFAGSG